ncbi:MAG: hypothetical protein ACK499_13345, partial [Betaproteobacteria bacterium]
MNAQFDLFASTPSDTRRPVLADPPGTWGSRAVCWHDVRQSLEWLDTLAPLPEYVPPWIASLISRYTAAYREVAAHPAIHVQPPQFDDDVAITLNGYLRNSLPADHSLYAEAVAFHARMVAVSGTSMGNTCIKTTWPTAHYTAAGVTFPGHLSVICRVWAADNAHIEISDANDDFFFESYQDTTTVSIVETVDVHRLYASQKIAEARTKPATIRPFYLNNQAHLMHAWRSQVEQIDGIDAYPIEGYKLIARSDWPYQTHTYAELCAMWDDGSRQRGDMRGLTVHVGASLAVLSKFVRVY